MIKRSFLLILVITFLLITQSSVAQIEEIQQRGKLTIAVKDNVPPLAFRDAQGNLQGLEIDLAKYLAAELLGDSEAVLLKPVKNQERLEAVMTGKVDIAIARVTFTPSRARLVDFSPYYYLDGAGIVSKNPSVNKVTDLANGKIIVLNGSSTIAVVRYHLPNAQLIGVDSYQEALAMLEANQGDGFAGDKSILTGWILEYPQYHLLPERLSTKALCVVMPKGLEYQELRDRVNEAISTWQSTWLPERLSYWGLP